MFTLDVSLWLAEIFSLNCTNLTQNRTQKDPWYVPAVTCISYSMHQQQDVLVYLSNLPRAIQRRPGALRKKTTKMTTIYSQHSNNCSNTDCKWLHGLTFDSFYWPSFTLFSSLHEAFVIRLKSPNVKRHITINTKIIPLPYSCLSFNELFYLVGYNR